VASGSLRNQFGRQIKMEIGGPHGAQSVIASPR